MPFLLRCFRNVLEPIGVTGSNRFSIHASEFRVIVKAISQHQLRYGLFIFVA